MANSDPRDGDGKPEGWESMAEDADGGSLGPNPELEEALRAAEESYDANKQARRGAGGREADPALVAEKQALEEEVASLKDRLIRLQADFENHRKRTLRERQDALRYGHENLVKDLLGTVDNLDRAIDHAMQSGSKDFESMLQGVELVRRELLAALSHHSVAPVDAEGEFDPNVHEAMAQLEVSGKPPGNIVDVLQKGYVLHDRLLRPARVVVAKEPEADDAASKATEKG
jgi:molecular chaperone GrpE